jgi:ligand-binding sensor domain-containing protein
MTTCYVPSFFILVLLVAACNRPVQPELTKEKVLPEFTKNIGNGNVQRILQDKAGNLWVGTSDHGLYTYDGKSFEQFILNGEPGSANISSLLEDNAGNMWIGTDAGPFLYDGKTVTKKQINVPKHLPPNTNELFRDSRRVHHMIQSKIGKLWFATIDGVYVYDGETFTHVAIDEAANGFLSRNDKAERMLEDKDGNLWFGNRTNEGVFRYDGTSVTHLKLPDLTLQFESKRVVHNWGWPQVQDKEGHIWFSNWAGAYQYDGTSFKAFSKEEGVPGNNGLVAKIIEDKNGTLWFGGESGLSRYDGKTFTNFTTGLKNPWIWEILEDKTGNLWVGTRQAGLYLFDGKTFIDYIEHKQ